MTIQAEKKEEIESEIQNEFISFASKEGAKEPLSEEEAIEEEFERSYNKKNDSFKRKFKPAIWDELEKKLRQKNCHQSRSLSNFKESLISKISIEKLARAGAYASIAGLAGIYAAEAFAVDIEAAAKAGVKPLRDTAVWIQPYLMGFAGMASAYFSEGDLKTRAIKTGIGIGATWAVSSGLISFMPNIA